MNSVVMVKRIFSLGHCIKMNDIPNIKLTSEYSRTKVGTTLNLLLANNKYYEAYHSLVIGLNTSYAKGNTVRPFVGVRLFETDSAFASLRISDDNFGAGMGLKWKRRDSAITTTFGSSTTRSGLVNPFFKLGFELEL